LHSDHHELSNGTPFMIVIIPARFASTRFPGKPLANIAGKPMIQHVYERAVLSGAADTIIATDDERIRRAAAQFGARVVMTSEHHRSGTERLAEAISTLGLNPNEIVVNVQGDEPLLNPELIRRVAEKLSRSDASVATLATPIHSDSDMQNPNIVKVIVDVNGYALYFSRAPIPWPRNTLAHATQVGYRHIGIYAYKAGFVSQFVKWESPELEETEQLEQLRVLWYGNRIAVAIIDSEQAPEVSVDTQLDLERVLTIISDTEKK